MAKTMAGLASELLDDEFSCVDCPYCGVTHVKDEIVAHLDGHESEGDNEVAQIRATVQELTRKVEEHLKVCPNGRDAK